MCDSGEAHWAGSSHDFTDEEKQKMAESLRKKEKYEQQRFVMEQQLAKVEDKILEMHLGYCAVHNGRRPILSLPNEVTGLIFDYVQLPASPGEVEDEEELEQKDRYLVEIVVSHVCRDWRSISLGYPNLWTKFFYTASNSYGMRQRVPLDRFEVYLKRSRSLPLYLWLDFRDRTSEEELNTDLLNLAIDHLERWKQFTLYADEDFWVLDCLRPLSNRYAPLLECLGLWYGREPGEDPEYELVHDLNPSIFANGAPNLKFCMLYNHSFFYFIPPRWTITTLRICGDSFRFRVSSQVIVDLLSLPSLQHLWLSGHFDEPKDSVLPIEMPNIKCLQVSDVDGIWSYFPNIRAPQLETLLIHNIFVMESSSRNEAWMQDQYCFPALKMLWVSNSYMGSVTHRFIQMTSEATNVMLTTSMTGDFFDFVFCEDGEELWPRLTVMTCVSLLERSVKPYTNFAKNRSRPFRLRLHPDLLSHWNELQKEECTRLEEFCVLEAWRKEEWPVDLFWPKYIIVPCRLHGSRNNGYPYDYDHYFR